MLQGSKALALGQSENQAAAGNEAAAARADTIAGQAGSLHAHTPEVEKQEEEQEDMTVVRYKL